MYRRAAIVNRIDTQLNFNCNSIPNSTATTVIKLSLIAIDLLIGLILIAIELFDARNHHLIKRLDLVTLPLSLTIVTTAFNVAHAIVIYLEKPFTISVLIAFLIVINLNLYFSQHYVTSSLLTVYLLTNIYFVLKLHKKLLRNCNSLRNNVEMV